MSCQYRKSGHRKVIYRTFLALKFFFAILLNWFLVVNILTLFKVLNIIKNSQVDYNLILIFVFFAQKNLYRLVLVDLNFCRGLLSIPKKFNVWYFLTICFNLKFKFSFILCLIVRVHYKLCCKIRKKNRSKFCFRDKRPGGVLNS